MKGPTCPYCVSRPVRVSTLARCMSLDSGRQPRLAVSITEPSGASGSATRHTADSTKYVVQIAFLGLEVGKEPSEPGLHRLVHCERLSPLEQGYDVIENWG